MKCAAEDGLLSGRLDLETLQRELGKQVAAEARIELSRTEERIARLQAVRERLEREGTARVAALRAKAADLRRRAGQKPQAPTRGKKAAAAEPGDLLRARYLIMAQRLEATAERLELRVAARSAEVELELGEARQRAGLLKGE